ncbi:MAG: lysophospholipase [Endomicrobiaceae bacterium]|nr:lysophospholipase [Endomicrobiaceae bacterium]
MKKFLKRLLLSIVFLVVIYFSVLYFFQYNFLFEPDTKYKSPKDAGFDMFSEEIVTAKDGTQLMTWYFEGDEDKPLILFFHGNTGLMARFTPAIIRLTNEGYSVAMIEYRGFGNTKGKISQETAFSDAVSFYDYYKNKKADKKIIFYGYSFGCAFVMGLTQYRDPEGIILTAPFSSLYQEVKEFPVPFAFWVLKDKYPSDEYIKNIKCPLLIIHGTNDKLIDKSHSQRLFDFAPVKDKSIVFVGNVNHHDVFFKEKNNPMILEWLQKFN